MIDEFEKQTEENDDELESFLGSFLDAALEYDDDDDDDDFPDFPESDATEDTPNSEVTFNPNNVVKVEVLQPLGNPYEELRKLVGCTEIKDRIEELATLSRYNRLVQEYNPTGKQHQLSLHSLFLGKPGTGKTTVCKIYGSLLHDAGVLSKGHVVVCGRSTFLGSNWGDEERAVRQLVEMAQGGVLMIDEAYQLNSDNKNDPGKLVLPLLMSILSDESQRDIAIVLCGYKDEMERLIEQNPGLTSRFPNRFEFKDFSVDELMRITQIRLREFGYSFTRSAMAKYRQLLSDAFAVRDPKTWGNARFVANQLERIYLQHARRCMRLKHVDRKRILQITPADIQPIEVPRAAAKPRIGF